MKNMSKVKGFTLIELVVVIVILGILAATAAPKFIDLTGDAKESIVEGVRGSINSAADMAHAKALVSGQAGATGQITVAGSTISLIYGWPATNSIDSLLTIEDITATNSGSIRVFTHSSATGTPCRALYDMTAVTGAEARPAISSDGSGC